VSKTVTLNGVPYIIPTTGDSGNYGAQQTDFDTAVANNINSLVATVNPLGMVNVKDITYGALGNDIHDDTAAFVAAIATGKIVYVPYGVYKITSHLLIPEGGIIGEGWGTGVTAKSSILKFYNLGSAINIGAIYTRVASGKGGHVRLENIRIIGNSWDVSTGANCHGLDIEAPVDATNVLVEGFKEFGVYLHNDTGGNGPYESVFTNVRSNGNGKHGFYVGVGANVLAFINCSAFYNGRTAYGVGPVAGLYDGFMVSNQHADGAHPDSLYYNYTPQALTIIGGDCSYNARYGWNLDIVADSPTLNPGYAEGNYVKEARVGVAGQSTINFGSLYAYGAGQFADGMSYGGSWDNITVSIAGKRYRPDVYNFDNLMRYGVAGQSSITQLATDGTNTILHKIPAPAEVVTAGNRATPSIVTMLKGSGSWGMSLGGGNRTIRVEEDYICMPAVYYRKTADGWDGAAYQISHATSSPTPTIHDVKGTVVTSTAMTPGGDNYIEWRCTQAGDGGSVVGVWEGFGQGNGFPRREISTGNSTIYWSNTQLGTGSPTEECFGRLTGYGTYGLGIGSGDNFLKIGNNQVRLPPKYTQATTVNSWDSAELVRGLASTIPTGGGAVGDIYYNTAPASAGFIGWVCTVAHATAATWKGFGVIA
jgi:hypothetical protein